MTLHDWLIERLSDPEPAWREHARLRLEAFGTEPPDEPAATPAAFLSRPPDPRILLAGRVRQCPHWSPGVACCDGWACKLDPDELRTVRLADCETCPELPA